MAKALERDEPDLTQYLTKIDTDLLRTAKDKVDKRFAELARAAAAPKGQPKGQSKGTPKGYGDSGNHGSSSAASGSKGGKNGKGDNRRVRSPPARPKGSAGSGQQHRSRSPRAGWHQSGHWDKQSWSK